MDKVMKTSRLDLDSSSTTVQCI